MNLGWWLRTYQRDGYGALIQEQVYGNGTVRMVHVLVNWGREGGIGPAFNLKRTSILSASLLSGTEGESGAEYKLTVFSNPDEMKIGVNEAIGANYVGNGMIAVPYTITGTNAADADQVSVLLLDHEYSPGETLTDTSRYDYGKLLMEDSFSVSGVGTISIPESYAGKTLGKDYYIYIFAEDIRDGRETDYATGLVKVTPQEESIFNDVFTSQPSDLTLPYGYGSGQTLSVGTKEPGAYNYSCQWYINGRKSYEVSTLLSGASGKSYEIPVGKTPVKEYYYCVVTVKQGGTTIAMVRSDIATLTVVKRGITLSGVIKAYDKVYDGTTDADIDYSQIQLEGLVNPGDVSVDITGRFESADAGENKRVIISDIILTGATSNYVVEDEAYQIFATASIRKAEVTGLQAPAAKTGLVFTGKAQELVLPGTAVGGKLNYAISRNSGEPDASLYRETLPTAINSGNYYVWYKVVGDPNHNDTAPQSLFVDIVLIPSLEGGRVCAPAGAKLILAYYARPENVTEGALFMSAIKEVNIASDCAEADPAKLLNISRIPVRNCQLLLVDQRTGIPLCKAWKP